jgi:hypothetical protein
MKPAVDGGLHLVNRELERSGAIRIERRRIIVADSVAMELGSIHMVDRLR